MTFINHRVHTLIRCGSTWQGRCPNRRITMCVRLWEFKTNNLYIVDFETALNETDIKTCHRFDGNGALVRHRIEMHLQLKAF